MSLRKTLAALLATLLLAGLLSACAGTPQAGDPTPPPADTTPANTAPATPSADELTIGMIANAFGTQSYNDDVLRGLELAETQFGCTIIAIEVPEVADTANALRTLITQGCTFLVVPSSEYRDGMEEIAAEYPDVKFLYLAESIDGGGNIMSTAYRENEGAFLAGALAGMLTQTNNVGAVMAISEPLQLRYQYGFLAGVQTTNPDCVVQTAFTNSYTDVNKGAEVAGAMYSKGADFVGTYSGACNLGVFSAASDAGEGKYAFGAANGQFDRMPDKIVASVVKPVDQAILKIIEEYLADGSFDTSTPRSLGLKEMGVMLLFSDNTDLLDSVVPADVRAAIEDLTAKVNAGDIVVPGTEAEFKTYNYTYSK